MSPGARSSLPVLAAVLAALAGCAQLPRTSVVAAPAPAAVFAPPPAVADGGIFQTSAAVQPLFEDRRARQVGDIVTIVFNEAVSAKKASTATSNRNGSVSLTPGLVPAPLQKLTQYATDLSGEADFSGAGGATASNSFTGTLTVTVQAVQPNGNLVVRGEKQIAINQGNEFIRFSGVVQPRTLSAQNSVPSTQVADARIEYVGDGYIHEAQTMGWLQRVMLNVLPF